jgi:hypothetical protein
MVNTVAFGFRTTLSPGTLLAKIISFTAEAKI